MVGTGGMLSITEEHFIGSEDMPGMNPQAQLRLYGQEWNDQSYAVCKSDMLMKGHDPSNIQLGGTLADDKFAGQTFDYCLSNPPYGDDWKKSQVAVMAELTDLGSASRFYAGDPTPKKNVPSVSDGQIRRGCRRLASRRPVEDHGLLLLQRLPARRNHPPDQ